jgi:hypothetical protein
MKVAPFRGLRWFACQSRLDVDNFVGHDCNELFSGGVIDSLVWRCSGNKTRKLEMWTVKGIVIYEPSAGRRCSRMSAFFKARATKERVPLINARMNGRCLHASGSYNIFCTKIKLQFFVLIR